VVGLCGFYFSENKLLYIIYYNICNHGRRSFLPKLSFNNTIGETFSWAVIPITGRRHILFSVVDSKAMIIFNKYLVLKAIKTHKLYLDIHPTGRISLITVNRVVAGQLKMVFK
jgi:hypothetical protein